MIYGSSKQEVCHQFLVPPTLPSKQHVFHGDLYQAYVGGVTGFIPYSLGSSYFPGQIVATLERSWAALDLCIQEFGKRVCKACCCHLQFMATWESHFFHLRFMFFALQMGE